MNTHRRISLLACTLGLLAAAMPASAQSTYPDHPVKLLVALPAGGGVDIIARLVGQKLAAATGQPFVVDNRAGASGRIGLPVVAKAAPDGYTLMASPASFLTTNKSIFKELPYDPQADFAPITKLANQSMVLVVRDKQKFASAGALLAAAKAKPGALNYASSGDGSPQHLAALMFETRAGVKMTHHRPAGRQCGPAVCAPARSAALPQVRQTHRAGADERQTLVADHRRAHHA